MLHDYIEQFLQGCEVADLAERSLEALTGRLHDFDRFVQSLGVNGISAVTYHHLLTFIADHDTPSVDVKKNRVWALHLFYHFLKRNKIIDRNIAQQIPYPKVGKKIPKYLTIDEFNRILHHFAKQAHTLIGLRNLIIIMLLGFLGLRALAVVKLNVEDVDLHSAMIWVHEKGRLKRRLCVPQVLCSALQTYLNLLDLEEGPLFLSKRKKRISNRTVQDLFRKSLDHLGIDKHLHAHLFRHTAATHLNKIADPDITQHVLGHALRRNTEQYTHLNPDNYVVYMKMHPYMEL